MDVHKSVRAGVLVLMCAMPAMAGCAGGADRTGAQHQRTTSPAQTTQSTPATPPSTDTPLPAGVISSIDSATGPIYLTDAFGSVWAPGHRDSTVDRIDPRTDRVVARIGVSQNSCSPAFPTPTRMLVSPCNDGTSSVLIDPRTDQVVGAIPGYVVDYAYGSGWFAGSSDHVLQRVDIATRHRITVARIWVGATAHALGKIWVSEADQADGTWHGGLAEVDPRSNRVIRTIKVADPGAYPNLVHAFGSLWLQGGGKPFFTRIDPESGAVRRFPIPDYVQNFDLQGGDITAGDGSLWMQTAPSMIGRFDPRTGRLVDHYPADAAGGGSWPLVADGSLWVSNFDSSTVWRDRLGG